jgi:hypothetical protein
MLQQVWRVQREGFGFALNRQAFAAMVCRNLSSVDFQCRAQFCHRTSEATTSALIKNAVLGSPTRGELPWTANTLCTLRTFSSQHWERREL